MKEKTIEEKLKKMKKLHRGKTIEEKLLRLKKKSHSKVSFKIKPKKRPVFNNFGLDGIIIAWEKFSPIILDRKRGGFDWIYNEMEEYVKNINYSVKDVEEFTKILKIVDKNDLIKSYYTGLYISALINNQIKKFDEIVMQISEPNISMDYLCSFLSQGTVYVEGNVGSSLGYKSQGGKIIAKGNSQYKTGNSNFGSSIEIDGIARNYTAFNMFNGSVRVGRAEGIIGKDMMGGKVIIESGKDKLLISSSLKGGEIYKGDRLIYPRWKKKP